ncbi:MAG: transposase, partial [Clostridiales bacterium]|nr:transposase [Clostridiales bacterium]
MNVAYRWFLGYRISEPIPHFAMVSYHFRHRFNSETVENVFCWILEEVNGAGYLAGSRVHRRHACEGQREHEQAGQACDPRRGRSESGGG